MCAVLILALIVILIIVLILQTNKFREGVFFTGPNPLRDPERTFVDVQARYPGCKDTNKHCPMWASGYECRRNPRWMFKNCPRSCGVCGLNPNEKEEQIYESVTYDKKTGIDPCADLARAEQCAKWRTLGWCRDPHTQTFMHYNCPRACGWCKYDVTLII